MRIALLGRCKSCTAGCASTHVTSFFAYTSSLRVRTTAVSELVAALRRPILPRPVSAAEQVLLRLGARFDDFMVRLWMRADRLAALADPGLRAEIERAHAFYRNPVFLTDPETFFVSPDTPDAVRELPVRDL